MELYFSEITNNLDLIYALAIRGIVFIDEQGCLFSEEFDEFDDILTRRATHVIGKINEEPIAAGRIIYHEKNNAKLERLAVLRQFRGNGFGKNLVKFMISVSFQNKCKGIYIHAQEHLSEYYQSLGFEAYGDVFQEARISHIKMKYNRR